MPISKSEFAAIVRQQLRELQNGCCSLTAADVESQSDPDLRATLGLIRALHLQHSEATASEQSRQNRLAQATVDELPINVFAKDSGGRMVLWNRAVAEKLGMSKEDVLGKTDYDIFPSDVADALRETDRKVLSGDLCLFEEEQVEVDGERKVFFAGKRPLQVEGFDDKLLLGFSLDISEKKQVERELKAERELIQQVLDHNPNPIAVTDRDGRFILANRSFGGFYGVAPERLLSLTGFDFHGRSDEVAAFVAVVRRVVDDQRLERVEFRFTPPDGQLRWFDTTIVPITLASGERCALTISAEITERKHQQTQDAYLTAIVSCSVDAICSIDRRGQIVYWNPAAETLFGYSRDEMVGTSITKLTPASRTDESAGALEQLWAGESVSPFETRRLCKDGREIDVLISISPVRLESGEIVGLAAIIRDISERKRIQNQIANQSQFLQALIDTVPDLIFVKDMDFNMVLVNNAFCEHVGYPRHEILGTTVRDRIPPEISRNSLRTDNELIRRGDTVRSEYWTKNAAGQRILLDTIKVPWHDANGKLAGVFAISRDATERRLAEDEIREAKRQAEAATVAKSQFLANISHEIRTPLNGVLGMASLLASTDVDDEQREYIDIIRTSGSTLLALINDVLDFSKLESAGLSLVEEPFSLIRCLNKAMNVARASAQVNQLSLSMEVDPAAPDVIVGDSRRLLQVLSNLINNAIKFTSAGGVTASVRVVAREEDALELCFSVQDTGIGIPEDKLASLFERFTQVDASTTRRYGGSGLGLAISKYLVELMGGRIWVETKVGLGSTFSFTIHTVAWNGEEHATRDEDETWSSMSANDRAVRQSLRILVAEDNFINQKVAVGMLAQLGYKADVVATGIEVLKALEQISYDLIFMDIHMPMMDGVATTQQIFARLPEGTRPVIVAMTADAMHGDRERCLAIGMNDYISKPVTLDKLRKTLARWDQSEQLRPAKPASPGAEVWAQKPLVDRELFDSYGPELMRELLQAFIETVPPRIVRIAELIESSDYAALAEEAHTLKGAGLNLGVSRFANVCSVIEEQSRNGEMADAALLLGELKSSYDLSKTALRELLAAAR